MRRFIPLFFLLLPAALFAQSQGTPMVPRSPKSQETALLKSFGLTDAQAAQVFDIQDKTRTTLRQDAVQLRLLHAQMEKALLPDSPNMQDVNGFITQISQTRADMMKAFVGARVELRQIIGQDNFPVYSRFIMRGFGQNRAFIRMRRPAADGMMGGAGAMMGPRGAGRWSGADSGTPGYDAPMMSFNGAD